MAGSERAKEASLDTRIDNLTARFDMTSASPSIRGVGTVRLLQLDRREAMTEGYRRTYRRLSECISRALAVPGAIDEIRLVSDLLQLDDHGLMGWCFGPVGSKVRPFADLLLRDPNGWSACVAAAQ